MYKQRYSMDFDWNKSTWKIIKKLLSGKFLVQHQINAVTADVEALKERYPEAEDYIPQPIL